MIFIKPHRFVTFRININSEILKHCNVIYEVLKCHGSDYGLNSIIFQKIENDEDNSGQKGREEPYKFTIFFRSKINSGTNLTNFVSFHEKTIDGCIYVNKMEEYIDILRKIIRKIGQLFDVHIRCDENNDALNTMITLYCNLLKYTIDFVPGYLRYGVRYDLSRTLNMTNIRMQNHDSISHVQEIDPTSERSSRFHYNNHPELRRTLVFCIKASGEEFELEILHGKIAFIWNIPFAAPNFLSLDQAVKQKLNIIEKGNKIDYAKLIEDMKDWGEHDDSREKLKREINEDVFFVRKKRCLEKQ